MHDGSHNIERVARAPLDAEQQWEFDHVRLLYRGGASANPKIPTAKFDEKFGRPDLKRLPLLLKIKDVLEAKLSGGCTRQTIKSHIYKIRKFYTWADESNCCLTMANVESQFLKWSDYLSGRAQTGAIKALSAYGDACGVSVVLDEILDLAVGLIKQTRHRRRHKNGQARFGKVNIEQAFTFGHVLCDLCDALTVEAIRGRLPVPIPFRNGQHINHWSGLRNIEDLKNPPTLFALRDRVEGVLHRRHAWDLDTSNRTRRPLINLRIQAEMLIFIAQTGMNRAQAQTLSTGHFSYQSHSDGYLVRRAYKPRRQGQVVFEIYTEYRPFFERYVDWLKGIFHGTESDSLFPFIAMKSSKCRSLNGVCENLKALRIVCKKLGVSFVVPRELRKVRINWFARRSGDLDLTAEMAQHSKEMLLQNYLEPDPQVAATELTLFFRHQDSAVYAPPGPGVCIEKVPVQLARTPRTAPAPDCVSPAGCIFCTHQRDIDSLDHVWSLMTYRHLKNMELATYRPPAKSRVPHPAAVVVDKVTEKIKLFEESTPIRKQWVQVSQDRVRESDYHPMWSGFIELMEGLQ